MKPSELFEKIKNTVYTKTGYDVDWSIEVDEQEKTIYLLFAKSNSIHDWINNLSFPVKVYKRQKSKLRCAMGWRSAWKSCNDVVMDMLIEKYHSDRYTGYKVVVCGWSYGGAISLLAAEDFAYRTGYKTNVITFGAPKPFFGRKSIKYLKRVLGDVKEYCHKNDIVTYLPPFFGYKHVKKNKLGKFNFFGLFNPRKWHCIYGEEKWYEAY